MQNNKHQPKMQPRQTHAEGFSFAPKPGSPISSRSYSGGGAPSWDVKTIPAATDHERIIYRAQQRLTPNDVPSCPHCDGRMGLHYGLKLGGYYWRCINPGRFKCWGSRTINQDQFLALAAAEEKPP